MASIPGLDKLSVNEREEEPPEPPSLLRELPEELRRHALKQLVQRGRMELCGRLYERCLLLFGSGKCGANDPIWRQACERFGLRRMVEANWRTNFQALCQEMQIALDNKHQPLLPTKSTFFLYVQGRAKEVEVDVESSVLQFFDVSQFPLLREAFLGLGAVEDPTEASLGNLKNALVSGDVNAVKAAIGTGVNAGVRELFRLVFFAGLPQEEAWWMSTNFENDVEGHLQWIRLLLEAGVRTDAVTHGNTVLARAVLSRRPSNWTAHTRIVQLLLELGVDQNDGGPWNPPLAALVKNAGFFWELPGGKDAFEERSRLLLDHGADQTLPGADGVSALMAVDQQGLYRNPGPDEGEFWDAYKALLIKYR